MAAKKIVAAPKGETVTKTGDGAEVVTEHPMETKVFEKEPCIVKVALGSTINLGNYSSARADVAISIPCLHGEIEGIYDFAKGWCEEKMAEITSEIAEAKK